MMRAVSAPIGSSRTGGRDMGSHSIAVDAGSPWFARHSAHRCLVASRHRAFPSTVRGPVDKPPCIRQRPFSGRSRSPFQTGDAEHGAPSLLRHRAPQRGGIAFRITGRPLDVETGPRRLQLGLVRSGRAKTTCRTVCRIR